jgi:hypothetical protein
MEFRAPAQINSIAQKPSRDQTRQRGMQKLATKRKLRTIQTQDLSESLRKKDRNKRGELPAQEQRKSSAGELLLRKEALNHTD